MAIGSKGLLDSKLLDFGSEGDDEDPRTGLVNLADVMLVFACGLIVALVAHYNVDLTAQDTPEDMEHVNQQVQEVQKDQTDTSATYAEFGSVYQDTETGELYIVKDPNATDVRTEE